MTARARSTRSLAAEAAFRTQLDKLGATLLEPAWLGGHVSHRVRCAAGHDCRPRPHSVQQGQGICRMCAGTDRATAEAAFRARVGELGGTVLGNYVNVGTPVLIRCAAGHYCHGQPSYVRQGGGVCKVCAGQDSAGAAAAFRDSLDRVGATLLERDWLGSGVPHRARCAEGHDCRPRPDGVQRGRGICRVCARQDPATAEANFRARLTELGATPLYEKWLGKGRPHYVRCAAGHDCWPRPAGVRAGQGCCKTCGTLDRARPARSFGAEAAFYSRLRELGAELVEPEWLGTQVPHHVRCAAGHECEPRPESVLQGQGICRACAGMLWDAFYVVAHDGEPRVKFGITSGDTRPRLRAHHRNGYTSVVCLVTNLPEGVALNAERAVKSALTLAGERPVQGREYFDISCLPLIMDVARGWLASNDNDKAA